MSVVKVKPLLYIERPPCHLIFKQSLYGFNRAVFLSNLVRISVLVTTSAEF